MNASWIFKGVVIRPIVAIILIAIMLTLIFVGPSQIYTPAPLKVLSTDDLFSSAMQPRLHSVQWTAPDCVAYLKQSNETAVLYSYNTTSKVLTGLISEDKLSQAIGRRLKISQFSRSYSSANFLIGADTVSRPDGMLVSNFIVVNLEKALTGEEDYVTTDIFLPNITFHWLVENAGGSPSISVTQWSPTRDQIFLSLLTICGYMISPIIIISPNYRYQMMENYQLCLMEDKVSVIKLKYFKIIMLFGGPLMEILLHILKQTRLL